jgi:hypothetical protein
MNGGREQLLSQILAELEVRGCKPEWKGEKGEYQAHCPFHDDEHKSMWVNPNGYWNCFACRPTGRDASFVGLAEKLGILAEEGIVAFSNLNDLFEYYHQQLLRQPALVKYLKEVRCLSDNVIRRAKLGFAELNGDYYLVIPMLDENGMSVNAKLRLLSKLNGDFVFSKSGDKPKYRWMTKLHGLVKEDAPKPNIYPSGLQFNWKEDGYVWVAGGELDALALWSQGIPAVAPTKGETGLRKEDLLSLPDWIVIALDAEEEVQHKCGDYIATLLENGKTVTHLVWKEKDVTEVLANNGSLWKSLLYARTLKSRKQTDAGIIPAGETTYYAIKLKEDDETYSVYAMTQNLWMPEVVLPVPEEETSFVVVGKEKVVGRMATRVSMGSEFSVSALHRVASVLSPKLLGKPRLTQVIGNFASDLMSLFTPTHVAFPRPGLYLSPEYGLENRQGLVDWQAPQTAFVFADGTIPEVNGKFYDIYLQNMFSSITAFARGNDDELKEFVGEILHIYPDESLYAVLAWYHAAILSTFVRLVNDNRFPVLFVAGIAGTGKTSIVVDLLQKVFAPTPHIPSRQTASTMRKYTNMSSFPLVLDEFTPERWGDDIKEAKLFVHSCYEMLMQQVSRSARQLEIPYFSYTPLCCIGESAAFITRDPAISDRVFLVVFKRKTEKLDKEYQDRFKKLLGQTHIHPYYRYRLLTFLIEQESNWMGWWNDAQRIVLEQVGAEYSARQRNNISVIVFGWIVFCEFAKSLEVVTPKAGDIAHYFFGKTETAPLHDPVIRILSYWMSEKDELLLKGEDWGIIKKGENAGKLWIRLKSFLDKLSKRYRDERMFQMSSYEVYLQLKAAHERHHPVIVGLNEVVKNSDNKPIKAVLFDLEVAKRDFLPDIYIEEQLQLGTDEQEGGDLSDIPF